MKTPLTKDQFDVATDLYYINVISHKSADLTSGECQTSSFPRRSDFGYRTNGKREADAS